MHSVYIVINIVINLDVEKKRPVTSIISVPVYYYYLCCICDHICYYSAYTIDDENLPFSCQLFFLRLKECIKLQLYLTCEWWLDNYFSPSSVSSWSEKDLQGNRWSPEWWRARQGLWTSPGDDHVCSVCQRWVWLRHGLWARNRPLLFRIPCESHKVVHEILQRSHSEMWLYYTHFLSGSWPFS